MLLSILGLLMARHHNESGILTSSARRWTCFYEERKREITTCWHACRNTADIKGCKLSSRRDKGDINRLSFLLSRAFSCRKYKNRLLAMKQMSYKASPSPPVFTESLFFNRFLWSSPLLKLSFEIILLLNFLFDFRFEFILCLSRW